MKVVLIVLALVGAALAVKHIPIKRVKSIRDQMKANGQWEDYLKMKASSVQEGLKDYSDEEYVSEVQIGTPAQTFQVVMDTGSADLWVTSSKCTSTITCNGKTEYSSSKSSTYSSKGEAFHIQYGSGSCSGTVDYDKVCIAGVCVNDQPFAEATTLASAFVGSTMDGICGLAFETLSFNKRDIPPVQNMIQQNLLDNPFFTVWLTADGGSAQGQNGGQITLGDYDTEHCSSTCDWVPLSDATYYEFVLDGYRVASALDSENKSSHPKNIGRRNRRANDDTKAISDTGTSFIYGPTSDIDAITKALGATQDGGSYTIPCNKKDSLPDVIFTLNGKDYPVRAKNYVIQSGDQCLVGFGGQRALAPPQWILGDCFIREYCNVYDMGNKRLGLCKATS